MTNNSNTIIYNNHTFNDILNWFERFRFQKIILSIKYTQLWIVFAQISKWMRYWGTMCKVIWSHELKHCGGMFVFLFLGKTSSFFGVNVFVINRAKDAQNKTPTHGVNVQQTFSHLHTFTHQVKQNHFKLYISSSALISIRLR